MTPQLITYLILFISLGYIGFNLFSYYKNKNDGYGFHFKPLYLIAAGILLLISIYAIATGQTYDNLVDKINVSF